MEGLIEGRIVHYVMPNGEHRPAVVVRVWNPEGTVNLSVFIDGINDEPSQIGGIITTVWKTSIVYSDDKKPNTWHWTEKA